MYVFFLVVLYLYGNNAYASTLSIESVAAMGNDAALDTVAESLRQNPLDVNAADREELALLPFLDTQDVDEIIRYRSEIGYISSSHELQRILGISAAERSVLDRLLVFAKRSSFEYKELELAANAASTKVLEGATAIRLDSKKAYSWSYGIGISRYPRYYLQAQQHSSYGEVQKTQQYLPEYLGVRFSNNSYSLSIGDYNYHNGLGLLIARSARHTMSGNGSLVSGFRDNQNGNFTLRYKTLQGVLLETREPGGQLSVYTSYKLLDVYQYRLRHLADSWIAPVLGECDEVSQRLEYYCDDGAWYHYTTVDASTGQKYQYIYLQDRLLEKVAGVALQFRRVTGYTRVSVQHLSYALSGESDEYRLSPSSPYSDIENQNYIGLYDSLKIGMLEWDNEVVSLQEHSTAYLGRMRLPIGKNRVVALSARYIPAEYRNPLARISSMPDVEDGLRFVNEKGFSVLFYCRYCHLRWQFALNYKAPVSCENCQDQSPERILAANAVISSRFRKFLSWKLRTSSLGQTDGIQTIRQTGVLRTGIGNHVASINVSTTWEPSTNYRTSLRLAYRYAQKDLELKTGLANSIEYDDEHFYWFDAYRAYLGMILRKGLIQLELKSFFNVDPDRQLHTERILASLKIAN